VSCAKQFSDRTDTIIRHAHTDRRENRMNLCIADLLSWTKSIAARTWIKTWNTVRE